MSEPTQPSHAQMKRGIQQRCIIVGFDFGTTFSGIAWTVFNSSIERLNDAEIRTVRAWPSSHGPDRDESKVPSVLIYNTNKEVVKWGYEEPEGDETVLQWFKLAIVPEKDLPPQLRNSSKLKETRKKIKELGLTPKQVISQYIHKIWDHAKEEIKKSVGERDFNAMPIRVVFTVPAIWGNRQIKDMEEAASSSIISQRDAGMTTVQHLSEPEAAVQAYARQLQYKLRRGEAVVVPDLGGGTNDVISYTKVGEGDDGFHIELEEATHGDGDTNGSIQADEAFEKLLIIMLRGEHKDLKDRNPAAWARILKEQWQHWIKRTFEYKVRPLWPVMLSNATADWVDLHEDQIRNVLEDAVVSHVLRLVERQVGQIREGGVRPAVILPVGGFGRCPYVQQRLREVFEGVAIPGGKKGGARKRVKLDGADAVDSRKIEVHSDTGEMPWTAVCRGACLYGLRAQMNMCLVKSRLSRTSICFVENAAGSAGDGGVWNPSFGEFMIPDKLQYLVKKGDPIDTTEKAQQGMFLAFDMADKGMHYEKSVFYAYDGDSPPARYDPDDAGLREYGVMEIKVPKAIEKLPIERENELDRRVFDYMLQKEIVGGSVQVTAIDPATGKVVGELVLADLDTF